jgi:hypothetical protein
MTMPSQDRYIPRQEFEGFRASVSSSFDQVNSGLASVARKLDAISSRGTDWRAVFGGLSVMATVIVGVVSMGAWGLNNKIDLTHAHETEVSEARDERLFDLLKAANARVDRLETRLEAARSEAPK